MSQRKVIIASIFKISHGFDSKILKVDHDMKNNHFLVSINTHIMSHRKVIIASIFKILLGFNSKILKVDHDMKK